MYFRPFIGLAAAGLTIAELAVGARGLILSVEVVRMDHSWSMAAGGLINAGLMILLASVTARLAYRIIFWRRHVASARARARVATPPSEQR